MPVFRYKFERILKVKEKAEDLEKLKLGEKIKEKDQAEAKKNELVQMFMDTEMNFRSEMSGKIDPQWLKQYTYALEDQKKKINQQLIIIQHKDELVEKQRQILVEAMKQRKIYENLREKALTQYLLDEEHASHIGMDELVSYKFNRGDNE